ncbi:HET-domain-containing protein, partial [Lentithecium fluviatile CBS 122367]
MNPKFAALLGRCLQAFGSLNPPFPYKQDLDIEQRELIWEFMRTAELRGTLFEGDAAANKEPNQLCDACRRLPSKLNELARLSAEDHTNYVHLDNAQDLVQSSKTCLCCALFFLVARQDQFRVWKKGLKPDERAFLPLPLRLYAVREEGTREGKSNEKSLGLVGLQLDIPWALKKENLSHLAGILSDDSYYTLSMPMLMAISGMARGPMELVRGRLPFEKADCDSIFEWLRNSARECGTHSECGTLSNHSGHRLDYSQPSRVLQIERLDREHEPTVVLREVTQLRDRYAALSHCWGALGQQPLRTMRSSIENFQKSIPFQDLPPTFQDAVIVTSELGLQHLWIDSLCIIQDSPEDWAKESVKMGSVYGNAYVTISASHARNSSYGLFQSRQSSSLIEVNIPVTPDDPDTSLLTLAAAGVQHSHRCSPYQGPLRSRAWCFQEEALSKRIVWFTDGEVIWQCRNSVVSETGLSLRYKRTDWSQQLNNWLSVIEEYSRRQVTYPKDRLVAIEGI